MVVFDMLDTAKSMDPGPIRGGARRYGRCQLFRSPAHPGHGVWLRHAFVDMDDPVGGALIRPRWLAAGVEVPARELSGFAREATNCYRIVIGELSFRRLLSFVTFRCRRVGLFGSGASLKSS